MSGQSQARGCRVGVFQGATLLEEHQLSPGDRWRHPSGGVAVDADGDGFVVVHGGARRPLVSGAPIGIPVGEQTVRIGLVALPPTRAERSHLPTDFRPLWLDRGDRVFARSLGVWSVVGFLLAVGAWNAAPAQAGDLPQAWVRMTPRPPVSEAHPLPTAPPPPASSPGPSRAAEHPRARTREPAATQEPERASPRPSSLLQRLVGTRGPSSRVERLWSDDDRGLGAPDLRDADAATTDPAAATRVGRRAGAAEARIGEPGTIGGGEADDLTVAVRVTGTVSSGQGVVAGTGDADAVRAAVDGYAGQLRFCYEKQLKVTGSLEGRIEVAWAVADGVVTGAPVVRGNTTGDEELAACVARKIRRWSFPDDVEGALSWPFVFVQGG